MRIGPGLGKDVQLANAVVEGFHPSFHGRIAGELAHTVVVQVRSGGPEANEGSGPIVAAAAARRREVFVLTGEWVENPDLTHSRKLFIGFGREILPHIVGD